MNPNSFGERNCIKQWRSPLKIESNCSFIDQPYRGLVLTSIPVQPGVGGVPCSGQADGYALSPGGGGAGLAQRFRELAGCRNGMQMATGATGWRSRKMVKSAIQALELKKWGLDLSIFEQQGSAESNKNRIHEPLPASPSGNIPAGCSKS